MESQDQQRIELLYRQVVELGDRARGWFDGPGAAWRARLAVDGQAAVAIESLATTARLLALMAWLLDPAQVRGQLPAFVLDDVGQDLPEGSPLAGTAGGQIAIESRRLAQRVVGLVSNAYAGVAPAGDTSERLSSGRS